MPVAVRAFLAVRVFMSAAVLALGGCTAEPVSPTQLIPVAAVAVVPSAPVVSVGATATLTAFTLSDRGDTLPRRQVAWSSSDPAVATVDPTTGVTTGVATGSTTITATAEGKTATLTLTVSPVAVASVTIMPATLSLNTGARATLTGTARDGANAALPGRVFAWSSSAPAVAQVSPTGVVTAVGAGSATVAGASEGKSAAVSVSVTLTPIASIIIAPSDTTIGAGDTLRLTATAKDAGGATLTGRTIQWTSSDPSIASVDNQGLVTGKVTGSVTITAQAEGISATATVRVGLKFAAVSAGRDFSCGVTTGGTVYCWGLNSGGSLGTGSPTNRLRPARVLQTTTAHFDSVSAGGDHACGLTHDGAIFCWGTNTFGQLGDGSTTDSPIPVAVVAPFGVTFAQVRAGASFTCARSTMGVAFCWGLNDAGQLGSASNFTFANPNSVPLEVTGGPFQTLGLTQGHVCAIDSAQRVICWGSNASGQLGRGGNPDLGTFVAAPIFGSSQYTVIAGGVGFTCGVQIDGTARCWGSNGSGEVGTTTATAAQTLPAQVNTTEHLARISAGNALACGVSQAGAGFCWGSNAFGKLGIGSPSVVVSPPGPRPVAGGLTFSDISAGWEHACGLTTSGRAYCWGRAHPAAVTGASALGNGNETDSNAPVLVADQ